MLLPVHRQALASRYEANNVIPVKVVHHTQCFDLSFPVLSHRLRTSLSLELLDSNLALDV